jgi:hypothetical protein
MKIETLQLAQYQDLVKQHKAVYQSWDKTAAIYITYVGDEVTATAEVAANSLVLAAPALTTVETIDLTTGITNTLAEVVAVIDALDDWECSLGSQFDGTEDAANLTIAGPSSVLTETGFAYDTNLQIKIEIPEVSADKKVTITKIIAKSTYGSGSSAIEIYKDDVLVWSEEAGATTVEKESVLPKLDGEEGETLTVKVVNSAAMTAGYLSVTYDEQYAAPLTI